jgi:hypothetical protein
MLSAMVNYQAVAQQWKKELIKLKNAYGTNINYVCDVEYNTLFDSVLVQTDVGHITYSKGRYHSKMNGYEIFVDGQKQVTVNHPEKTIILSKSGMDKFQAVELDSVFAHVDKVDIRNLGNGQRVMRVFQTTGDAIWIELTYDPGSLQIIQIRKKRRYLHPDENDIYREVILEVNYKNFSRSVKTNVRLFSASDYVEYTNQRWQLKPNYSNYELVNLIF